MYLLHRNSDGDVELCDFADEKAIPYAILSHTWDTNNDEISFDDVKRKSVTHKAGYKKIKFCLDQAAKDGLEWCWIDTCCINKANNTELSEAINSMFRWYRGASKCYVYLTDVHDKLSTRAQLADLSISPGTPKDWMSEFIRSRWFTRGWTLQELIAPTTVEFFSSEGHRLGERSSLLQEIHTVTGIAIGALRGELLSEFSIDERMNWASGRQTKKPEDSSYCLFGLFDVSMPLIYGEGKDKALKRLRKEISGDISEHKLGRKPDEQTTDRDRQCLQAWRLTDPRDDRQRILSNKDPLLQGSCDWILETTAFQKWWEDSRIFWVHGDPGKGKTMMMMALTQEILRRVKEDSQCGITSYFFCQDTVPELNNAVAVLRGLIFVLAVEHPHLIQHLTKKFDQAGERLFEGMNVLQSLWNTLLDIVQDPAVTRVYLMVDALDECESGSLRLLLDMIDREESPAVQKVKWIFSSRNIPWIGEHLIHSDASEDTSLELNSSYVAQAISSFIHHKVQKLSVQKRYKQELTLYVKEYLQTHANGTFLWVALVCKELEKVHARKTKPIIQGFPPDLQPLYRRMLEQISAQNDDDDKLICEQILRMVVVARRPLLLEEIGYLAELEDDVAGDSQTIQELIELCGSFLTVREETVYFIHQSAKDFFTKLHGQCIFPSTQVGYHRGLTDHLIRLMGKGLKEDVCELGFSGTSAEELDSEALEARLPPHLQYACRSWVEHAMEGKLEPDTSDLVSDFFETKLLFWLEALGWIRYIMNAARMVEDIQGLAVDQDSRLCRLLEDAVKFIRHSQYAMREAPLQVYSSALVFAPENSLIRQLYMRYIPRWIIRNPQVDAEWSACQQTLEGHGKRISAVVMSEDWKMAVTGSSRGIIKIWDAQNAIVRVTLQSGPRANSIQAIALSWDEQTVASVSYEKVDIWNAKTGILRISFELPGVNDSLGIKFSQDEDKLVIFTKSMAIYTYETADFKLVSEQRRNSLPSRKTLCYSHSSGMFAYAGNDFAIKLWDATSRDVRRTFVGHTDEVFVGALSVDGSNLASGSVKGVICVWQTETGAQKQHRGHGGPVSALVFSSNGCTLASASRDRLIKLWDVDTLNLLRSFESVTALADTLYINGYGTKVASGDLTGTLKLWDCTATGQTNQRTKTSCILAPIDDIDRSLELPLGFSCSQGSFWIWDLEKEEGAPCLPGDTEIKVYTVVVSGDSKQVALGLDSGDILLMSLPSRNITTLTTGDKRAALVRMYSPSGQFLVSSGDDKTKDPKSRLSLWDPTEGTLIVVCDSEYSVYCIISFSPDEQLLAVGFKYEIHLRSTVSMEVVCNLRGERFTFRCLAFTPDGKFLISAQRSGLKVWNIDKQKVCREFKVDLPSMHSNIATSADSQFAATLCSSPEGYLIQIWSLESCACLHIIDNVYTKQLRFSLDSTRVETERGSFYLPFTEIDKHPVLQNRDPEIFVTEKWITCNGKNVLYLHPDFRSKDGIRVFGRKVSMFRVPRGNSFITFDRHAMLQGQ